MLGSLVIVYPTVHRGGELVLLYKEHEWTFDASALMSSQPSPSLTYVAFYSDVEHEVLKVTSSSRVTLTYNLYLVPHDPISRVPVSSDPPTASVKPNPKKAMSFQARLDRLLKSPEFMPKGGTLAFGLAHLYPVTFKVELEDEELEYMESKDAKLKETQLQKIIVYLKGEDAEVYQCARSWNLTPSCR